MAWTQGERQEVTKIVTLTATLEERLNHCDRRLIEVVEIHRGSSQLLHDSCKKYELALADLGRDIKELMQWKREVEEDKKENKKWRRSFGPNVVAALLTIILAPVSVLLWNYFFPGTLR